MRELDRRRNDRRAPRRRQSVTRPWYRRSIPAVPFAKIDQLSKCRKVSAPPRPSVSRLRRSAPQHGIATKRSDFTAFDCARPQRSAGGHDQASGHALARFADDRDSLHDESPSRETRPSSKATTSRRPSHHQSSPGPAGTQGSRRPWPRCRVRRFRRALLVSQRSGGGEGRPMEVVRDDDRVNRSLASGHVPASRSSRQPTPVASTSDPTAAASRSTASSQQPQPAKSGRGGHARMRGPARALAGARCAKPTSTARAAGCPLRAGSDVPLIAASCVVVLARRGEQFHVRPLRAATRQTQ